MSLPFKLLLAISVGHVALPLSARADQTWPQLPEPPRSRLQWVAQDLRVNGLHSRIMRFDSELSVSEIVDFFERRWRHADGTGTRPLHTAGWEGLSTLVGDYQLTVQAKSGKSQGSTGLISAANMTDLKTDFIPKDWPRFADTKVLQVTESEDGPMHSVLVHQVSRASFGITIDRWRREWLRRGFEIGGETSAAPNSAQGKQWVAFFNKGTETADVTVAEVPDKGESTVAVNHVYPKDHR